MLVCNFDEVEEDQGPTLWETKLIVHSINIAILLTLGKTGATIILGTATALLISQMLTSTWGKQSWAVLASK